MSSLQIRLWVAGLLAMVVLSVAAGVQDYFYGDIFLAQAVQSIRFAPWKETMELVSAVGQTLSMATFALASFGWFLWKRQRAEYLVLGGAVLSLAVNPVLKLLVNRPRPTADLVNILGDSSSTGFPSGHAFTAMVVFGLLFYLAPIVMPWRRAAQVTRLLSVALIILIGISRVYLGVHWPSDVLGGFLVGGIVLALLIRFHRQCSSKLEPSQNIS